MEEIRQIFAENLTALRTGAGMTQAELAQKLNYSDKSISKWERAEGLPDVIVVKAIADTFGVSVDFLLTDRSKQPQSESQTEETAPQEEKSRSFDPKMITLVSILGVWTLAVLLFVIFWIISGMQWIILLSAIPVSLIVLLVLNSLWYKGRRNMLIVLGLVASIFLIIYYVLRAINPWQLIFVFILAEIIVVCSFAIKTHVDKK